MSRNWRTARLGQGPGPCGLPPGAPSAGSGAGPHRLGDGHQQPIRLERHTPRPCRPEKTSPGGSRHSRLVPEHPAGQRPLHQGSGVARHLRADDIPGPFWRPSRPIFRDIAGYSVLDIGCNAGYMSFEAKRTGADSARIDSNLGCRHLVHRTGGVLPRGPRPRRRGPRAVCSRCSPTTVRPRALLRRPVPPGRLRRSAGQGHVVRRARHRADRARVRLEPVSSGHARGPRTITADTSTFFLPSVPVLLELVRERGLRSSCCATSATARSSSCALRQRVQA